MVIRRLNSLTVFSNLVISSNGRSLNQMFLLTNLNVEAENNAEINEHQRL